MAKHGFKELLVTTNSIYFLQTCLQLHVKFWLPKWYWSFEPAWQLRSTHSDSHPFSHEVSTSLFSNFWILARQRSKCPWSMSTCTWRASKNTPPFPQAINPWKHVGLTVRPIAFCHVFHPTRSSNNSKSTLTVSHIFAGLTNHYKKDTFCLHYSPHVFKRCPWVWSNFRKKSQPPPSINRPPSRPHQKNRGKSLCSFNFLFRCFQTLT